jgi:hypothetical protein
MITPTKMYTPMSIITVLGTTPPSHEFAVSGAFLNGKATMCGGLDVLKNVSTNVCNQESNCSK